ncbi:hypothetical protein DPMN_069665 [Dreissena polymorpha]|uniref:Uncharacterized protein n=1 Tax=Dreissena polymorpha TaxID=45954 RepID=A0A9D4BUJ4_DREPO|nr:hypothetical protein DPMN_069665 [Dreissena polymorpha]
MVATIFCHHSFVICMNTERPWYEVRQFVLIGNLADANIKTFLSNLSKRNDVPIGEMTSLRLFAGKQATRQATTFRHVHFSRALIGVELRDIAQNTRQTSYIRKRRKNSFENFGATRFENDSDDNMTLYSFYPVL